MTDVSFSGAIFEVPHYKEYNFQNWMNRYIINEMVCPRMLSYTKRTSSKDSPGLLTARLADSPWTRTVPFQIEHSETPSGRKKSYTNLIEQVVDITHESKPGSIRARLSWESGGKVVTASMVTEVEYYDLMHEFRDWFEHAFPTPRVGAEQISVGFRYQAGGEIANIQRALDACNWSDIRENYSTAAQPDLDTLFSRTAEDFSTGGKIGLLYGPPGSGKTHLIRALAKEWRKWASIQYIVDVDQFFASAAYMMDILLKSNKDDSSKWTIIICEDAEEYLTPDAKGRVGQGLSRLLNVGDGLVGQGLNILFLFSTNAPAHKLHDAVVRDGRCFAHYEIPALGAEQATKWLGEPVTSETTLNTLYARREKSGRLDHQEDAQFNTGQYL